MERGKTRRLYQTVTYRYLVSVYNDIEAEDTFDKYFGAEGIKKVEKKGLEDL